MFIDLSTEVYGALITAYGIVKTLVICTSIAAPTEYRDVLCQTPYIGRFFVQDVTTAGKFVEYGLLVFAVFTVLRGMCQVKWIRNKHVVYHIMGHHTMYILYALVGSLLTLFYCVVLYTDYEIDQDSKYTNKYEGVNLVNGITFLAMIPTFMLFRRFTEGTLLDDPRTNLFLVAWLVVSAALIGGLVYKNYRTKKDAIDSADVAALVMIPASAV
jgi:hypothetical protein